MLKSLIVRATDDVATAGGTASTDASTPTPDASTPTPDASESDVTGNVTSEAPDADDNDHPAHDLLDRIEDELVKVGDAVRTEIQTLINKIRETL